MIYALLQARARLNPGDEQARGEQVGNCVRRQRGCHRNLDRLLHHSHVITIRATAPGCVNGGDQASFSSGAPAKLDPAHRDALEAVLQGRQVVDSCHRASNGAAPSLRRASSAVDGASSLD